MSKTLTNITGISTIDYSLNERFSDVNEIVFNDEPIGTGAIGSVYRIENIGGQKWDNLLLKIIDIADFVEKTFETLNILHDKLRTIQNSINSPIYVEYPELLGLPFIVLKGNLLGQDQIVTGVIMKNLVNDGFEDLGADEWDAEKYLQVDVKYKLYLSYQMAKCIDFLHSIKFIHSDLKGQSLFLNLKIPQVAFIDFDGGFNYDKQPHGLTLGALQDWMSARFKKLIRLGKSSKDLSFKERLDEENWNIAIGLFELIFGIQPFFFLKDNEEATIRKYLKNTQWPKNDGPDDIFIDENKDYHEIIINYLETFRSNGFEKLIDKFSRVFNLGFENPSKRPSPSEWKNLLFHLNNEFVGEPIIQKFTANKKTISFKGDSVVFSWQGSFYRKVYLNGVLCDFLQKEKSISFTDSTEVRLTFVSDFGERSEVLQVEAIKVDPKIIDFKSSISQRTDLTPVVLSWETKDVTRVRINSISEDLLPNGDTQVDPKEKTTFVLTAFGNFDQTIEKTITVDVESVEILKFNYEINIEKGIDNVDVIWETKNAIEVEISPRIGIVELSGKTSVGIPDRTEFVIVAKGYFNETSKTIEAKPFPIPIIKGLFIPTPILNLENHVPEALLQTPNVLQNIPTISINNSIEFNTVIPQYTELDKKLKTIYDNDLGIPETRNLIDKIFNLNKNQ
jgi:serine/threonine protein kinase